MPRIMVVPDLHSRDIDFSTIGNYTSVLEMQVEDLIRLSKEKSIDYMISAGDLVDKGYRNIPMIYSHWGMFEALSEAVNGNLYMCIGNHFFIERDSNPELYLIQPNDKFPTKSKVWRKTPIIKVVDKLIIDKMQISFFHFDKKNKNYRQDIEPGIVHHLGIYHDEMALPSSLKAKFGITTPTDGSYLKKIYDNITVAVHGHIHLPSDTIVLEVNGRQVPLIVPGSLMITKDSPLELHTHTKLPIFTIEDDKLKVEFATMSLHLDKLKFYKKKKTEVEESVLTKNGKSFSMNFSEKDLSRSLTMNVENLEGFLREKGYSDSDVEVVKKAERKELDLPAVFQYIVGGQKENE